MLQVLSESVGTELLLTPEVLGKEMNSSSPALQSIQKLETFWLVSDGKMLTTWSSAIFPTTLRVAHIYTIM